MDFCLSQGSDGPEVGLLIENLRMLGFDLHAGTNFTPQVSGALRMFQQSYHDHAGLPLKIDGRLGTSTALALDAARGRSGRRTHFDDGDLQAMSKGGATLARRAASIGYDEYMRACGEQSGDNIGPDVSRYQGASSRRGQGWSIDFATYCYAEAFHPVSSPLGRSMGVRELIKAAQKQDWLVPTIEDGLLAGDLIVWHYLDDSLNRHPSWHGQVGIVWRYHNGNIVTLEGDRGPYPSLVRPYRHRVTSLLRDATNGQLKNHIAVIRPK